MKPLLFLFSFIIIIISNRITVIPIISSSNVKIDTISYKDVGRIKDSLLYIEYNIDLRGKICRLPKGMVLVFKGGVICNGTIIGNMTEILCESKAFDNVRIEGTWNVPSISTSMFVSLSHVNALKNVIALAQADVYNTITIEKGDYQVAAYEKDRVCLQIPANTSLIIEGTIRLQPNNLASYDIIRAKGENISFKGHGTIVGDKHVHLGEEGEWGMGIALRGVENTTVVDLNIKDCWGDCIYVGGKSKNVLIENCIIDHGRRQGISVTNADSVFIKNCIITNVGGTNPEYAIDLEPNKGDTVSHIVIDHVNVSNCVGGINVTRSRTAMKGGAYVGDFTIKDCIIRVFQKHPIKIRRFQSATIANCVIQANDENAAIRVTEAGRIVVKNNRILIDKTVLSSSSIHNNINNNVMETGRESPIYYSKCRRIIASGNSFVER